MGRAAVLPPLLLLLLLPPPPALPGVAAPRPGAHGHDRLLIRLRQLLDVVAQLAEAAAELAPELLPAPHDVKNHCERAAFACFQTAPLRPARPGRGGQRLAVLTRQLRRRLPPPPAGRRPEHGPAAACPACASYEERPLAEFLGQLRALLQRMIAQLLS